MKLSREEVEKIARLARLDLSDEEQKKFPKQLSDILEYVEQLARVDVAGIEPMSHSLEVRNILRADEVRACGPETRAALVKEFPEQEDDLLRVPAVFG